MKKFCMVLLILACLIAFLFVCGTIDKETETKMKSVSVYDEKTVAVTFDDGPGAESTMMLLDGLKERNVRATFFLVGENIKGHEDIVKRMHDEGHIIGNHTYTHVILTKIPQEKALEEIYNTNKIIEEITGEKVKYIRPPCGEWNNDMFFQVDLQPVFWNVDPLDWKRKDMGGIVEDVVKNVRSGDIILLHDIYDTSVAAALEIIDRLKDKGFVFVTVDEILIS